MTAPLGVRVCPMPLCDRRIYVSTGGIVYARCLDHTLALLRDSFATPGRASDLAVPPVAGSDALPVASNRRS